MFRPISELPDSNLQHVVFWNGCQGPYLVEYMLADEAAEYREHDVFSHFLVLPEVTAEMREADQKRTAELNG